MSGSKSPPPHPRGSGRGDVAFSPPRPQCPHSGVSLPGQCSGQVGGLPLGVPQRSPGATNRAQGHRLADAVNMTGWWGDQLWRKAL